MEDERDAAVEELPADERAVGIAEFGYDIPIVFKLLLSGNPRLCVSMIFEGSWRL